MHWASDLLARFLRKVDGRELGRGEWLRAGWPRAALVLVVALPLVVAGPLRFVTGVGLALAFVLATLLVIVAVAAFAPALRRSDLSPRRELAVTVAVTAVAIFAAALPYNHHFHGLANYLASDGYMAVDGGYHLANYFAFKRSANVYGGFVSLYSFWEALRLSSRHYLIALNASFMFARVVVAVAPCLVAFSVLHKFRDDRRAWWTGAFICIAGVLVVEYELILPLESFHQMGGFWSHLFGVVPTMALWLADALIRERLLRLLALGAGVVLYRYTYGLNLADVITAVSALLICEALAKNLPLWARALIVAGAIVGGYAARYCFLLTTPLFRDWGWIVTHDVPAACSGQRLALASFGLTLFFWPARASTSGSGIVRALRFPLLFGLANALFIYLIGRLPTGTYYYFAKYDLHAVVLVASATVVVASFWAAVCVRRFGIATVSGLVAALALSTLGLMQVRRAFDSYQEAFHEQLFDGEYQRSQAWVIPAAVTRMQRTLEHENKSFGGYLSKRLPMYIFTNALFDHAELSWLRARKLTPTPGTCVFWDRDRYPDWDTVDKKQCNAYLQRPWGRYTVCGVCY
jgi:hypothetical protein